MKSNHVMLCKCRHAKSIHAGMFFKSKTPNLRKPCNYPGCKCKNYTPVLKAAST